jgi:hypothetical protein
MMKWRDSAAFWVMGRCSDRSAVLPCVAEVAGPRVIQYAIKMEVRLRRLQSYYSSNIDPLFSSNDPPVPISVPSSVPRLGT